MNIEQELSGIASVEPSIGDWSAGFLRIAPEPGTNNLAKLKIVWVENQRIVVVRVVEIVDAVSALVSSFIDTARARGKFPRSVRVDNARLVAALQRTMSPLVDVVQAPTPDVYRALARDGRLPEDDAWRTLFLAS